MQTCWEQGPIHIAVIDAAPLYTFQHDELHLSAKQFLGS